MACSWEEDGVEQLKRGSGVEKRKSFSPSSIDSDAGLFTSAMNGYKTLQ
jgi:hypothetical protein